MAESPTSKAPQERRRPKIVEAFLQDFNLIGLGGLAGLAVLTGSPIPLIAAGAAEALYLINTPGSRWFDRYLTLQRARRRGQRRASWRRAVLERLPRADRQRFRETQGRLALAEESIDAETRLVAQAELDRVEDLLDELLDLLSLRQAATRYLATIDEPALRRETREVARRLDAARADDTLARLEEQRLEILERRLAERDEMARNLAIVTSQIATLEHSIGYLADKLLSWSTAGRQPSALRDILSGVESTERAMEEVRPVLQNLRRIREGG